MTSWGDLKPHHYRVILLDPPSKFAAGTKGRPQHYSRMTDRDIAELPLRSLAHPDGAWIFCWITSPKLEIVFKTWAPGWGCKFSGRAFVWLKTRQAYARDGQPEAIPVKTGFHMGQGFTTRKNAEDVLLFKFGKPQRLSASIREEVIAPVREHSRKPDEVRDRICAFAPGPYVELFARSHDPRFDSWGDQVDLFDEVAA